MTETDTNQAQSTQELISTTVHDLRDRAAALLADSENLKLNIPSASRRERLTQSQFFKMVFALERNLFESEYLLDIARRIEAFVCSVIVQGAPLILTTGWSETAVRQHILALSRYSLPEYWDENSAQNPGILEYASETMESLLERAATMTRIRIAAYAEGRFLGPIDRSSEMLRLLFGGAARHEHLLAHQEELSYRLEELLARPDEFDAFSDDRKKEVRDVLLRVLNPQTVPYHFEHGILAVLDLPSK